jgi:TolB-like protein/DNA-binding winged helix-turn-helix (wHTH) protein/Flp pilus assembly protein TadD
VGDDFRVAAWLIEPRLNTVSRNGTTVHLEPKVMEVLVCLARHAGEPVTKDELLQTVWLDTFVTDDVLKRSISELRRVFEDDARESRIIQTIPKRGYRLIVPVEPVNGVQVISPALQDPESRRVGRKWWIAALASSSLAGLLLIVLATVNVRSLRERLVGKSASPQIRSIAVLPLENLSGDPSQEYFSDGMTDALITDLAQISSLKVISRTSSMQYKQTRKSLPEIARELNVDGIVEGTVQRSGDRVRITAQLIQGSSDKHLWANSYERDMRDIFALERDVTENIASQVQGRITAESQTRPSQPQPTNLNALEAYLQGNYHLNRYGRGSSAEEATKAADYFQQAIDADPNFAPAYLGMARAHDGLPLGSRENQAIKSRAEEKALQLDPNSSEAQLIHANIKWGDLDRAGAEQEFRRVIVLNPNTADAHDQLCFLLGETGRLNEAWRECQIAQELDPNNDHLSQILYERGDYDRAIATRRMMIERHPDDGSLHYGLSQFYAQKGMYKESVEELEKTVTLYGYAKMAANIHRAFATSSYRGAMRQAAEELEHLHATKQMFVPMNLADIYATLGEKDRALYWLEQAVAHRDMIQLGSPADYLGVDPMLASLHSEPRFKDLVRRMGLPP